MLLDVIGLTFLERLFLKEDDFLVCLIFDSVVQGCSQLSCSEWAKLMKERVEQPDSVKNGWLMEAFPKTRRQAFALRKAGVFPTHIVVIDDPVISQRVTL
ncbi:hypothetical protein AVEN_237147-1, partial [Araneus ventricosus]